MKLRRLVPLAAVGALVLGFAASASADDALDQQQAQSDANIGLGGSEAVAQTFTAGTSGPLDRVDLLLFQGGMPSPPVNVEIRPASSMGPGPTALESGSIPSTAIGSTPAFIPVTFASPTQVTAGTQYAIVAYSSDPFNARGWAYYDSDVYSGGKLWGTPASPPTPSSAWSSNPSADLAFKTYVANPEPTATPPPPRTGERDAALASCRKRAHKRHWPHKRLKRCRRHANLLPL